MLTSILLVALILAILPNIAVLIVALMFVLEEPRAAWKERKEVLRDIVTATWKKVFF
jgi:hypothetical protein